MSGLIKALTTTIGQGGPKAKTGKPKQGQSPVQRPERKGRRDQATKRIHLISSEQKRTKRVISKEDNHYKDSGLNLPREVLGLETNKLQPLGLQPLVRGTLVH